jgi:hypothetical protein
VRRMSEREARFLQRMQQRLLKFMSATDAQAMLREGYFSDDE